MNGQTKQKMHGVLQTMFNEIDDTESFREWVRTFDHEK